MPNGTIRNQYTIYSTSPSLSGFVIHQRNMREAFRKSAKVIADNLADQIQGVSNGDGRFLSSIPGVSIQLENDEGYFYHIVGINVGLDMSVAAP